MANIRLSVVDQDTGDNIPGRVLLTPRPMPGAGLWLDGEDIVAPTTREHPVLTLPSYMDDVEVPPAGWYYHLEFIETEYTEWGDPVEIGPDKPGGWRFRTDFLLLEDGNFYLEDLPTVDPCDPDSGVRPEPVWWRALRAVQDSMDSAVQDAEDAATRAEAAAIGGGGFSRQYDFRAYSEGPDGEPELVHGDPDAILTNSVASITKLVTVLLAARWHQEEGIGLGHVFTVDQWDIDRATSPGSRFQVGDEVRLEDLMYAAILPSDNIAPVTIARGLGYYMLQADGDPTGGHEDQYNRFVLAMNQAVNDMGFVYRTQGVFLPGAYFTRPGGGGRLSPRMVASIIKDCRANEVLAPVLAAQSHSFTVSGPDSREISVSSVISGQSIDFPELVAYKGGNQLSRYHAAMVWEHPETGEEHITVISDVPEGAPRSRYRLLRDALDVVIAGGGSWNAGFTTACGDQERATPWLDITSYFPNVEADGANSGVFIMRDGYRVSFRVQQVRFIGVEQDDAVGEIPGGFRPYFPAYGTTTQFNSGQARGVIAASGSGIVRFLDTTEDHINRVEMDWTSYQGFPGAPWGEGVVPHERT